MSLVIAPPRTPAEAAHRIALGLTALFALSPATRFGYFCYPLALYGWMVLAGPRGRAVEPDHARADHADAGRTWPAPAASWTRP